MNLVSIFLLYPSLERRLKDMLGSEERDLNFYLAIVAVIIGICLPLVNYIVLLVLMVVEGKITGKLPKNELLRFNWGAFLGTWIWGLFNKSYKTLWIIPLIITPVAFPLSLIYGIKGNEWAYKNKPSNSLQDFHKSQEIQAIVWAILSPLLSIVISVSLIFGSVMYVQNIEKQYPGAVKGRIVKMFNNVIKMSSSSVFEKYEKTPQGYKFYINPKDWKKSSLKNKNTYYLIAMYNVMSDEGISLLSSESLNNLVNTTKIYSSFNEEVLCECIVPQETQVNALNMAELLKKYIKINEIPSTP